MILVSLIERGARAFSGARAFPRFLLAGFLNTLFGYSVFYALLSATQNATLSLAVSTLLGVAFNFRSIGALVFGSSDPRRMKRFACVYAFLFVANALALAGLQRLSIPPALAQAALLLPVAALSFDLNRRYVFGGAGA